VKGAELRLDMLAEGLRSVPGRTSFMIDGETHTAADLLKQVDARRAVYKAVRDLRNQLRAKTSEKRDQRLDDGAFLTQAQAGFRASLGSTNPDLTKFGFAAVRAPRQLTAEENARKAEQARATRAARGTKGNRQKAAIHGVVEASPATRPSSNDGH
jgi:hypothetical protein